MLRSRRAALEPRCIHRVSRLAGATEPPPGPPVAPGGTAWHAPGPLNAYDNPGGRPRRAAAPAGAAFIEPMNHARASCAARAGNFTQSDHSGCINRDAVVMQIQTKYLHSVPWTSVRRCFGEIVVQLQGSCISVTNYQPGYFVYTTPREKAWILDGLAWQNFCASCLGRTTMRRTGKTVRGREEYSQLCTGILVL